jgi:hypothetical protein
VIATTVHVSTQPVITARGRREPVIARPDIAATGTGSGTHTVRHKYYRPMPTKQSWHIRTDIDLARCQLTGTSWHTRRIIIASIEYCSLSTAGATREFSIFLSVYYY